MLNNQLAGAGNEMSSHTQVIWGTNINTNDVSMKLKNFINNFEEMRDDEEDVDDDRLISSYYMQKIKEIRELDISVLEIDCDHIFQFDQSLYRQIVDYPSDIIPIFDLVVTQCYKDVGMEIMAGGNQEDQEMQFDEQEA
jgi:DNA replication licensing factor MCM4